MIWVTRLKGKKFVINADLIKYVEETPDTIITLRDGEKIMVAEKADDIVKAAIEYARSTRFPPEG
jgi:flagellar protein FlbD